MVRVLTTIGSYLPGYKAGGPIRSVANLINALGDDFEFYVITSDRDLGEDKPYDNLVVGSWQSVAKANVLYLSPADMRLVNWHHLLNSNSYDLLYLNSFFHNFTVKTLFLRALGLIPRKPTIVAPRGEFSRGAFSIGTLKKVKKQVYMCAAGTLNFYHQVIWQASSEKEASDILIRLGNRISPQEILVAPDIPNMSVIQAGQPNGAIFEDRILSKRPGFARIVFLSRIARMKNLKMAIELLDEINGNVEFDIYGPLEDDKYWDQCCAVIGRLPLNVRVCYKGVVPAEQVHEVFSRYHLFLFPTLGENYGHVIPEALGAGCLVVTSDRTPWQGFDNDGIGWTLPLHESDRFVNAIDKIIDMDSDEFECRSRKAVMFARDVATDQAVLGANYELFNRALLGSQLAKR